MLEPKEWIWVCKMVKRKFPDLKLCELITIIDNGTTGEYNERQFAINSFTIFRWIRVYLGIEVDEKTLWKNNYKK